MESKQTTIVQSDGRIELLVPAFAPGQLVEVCVRPKEGFHGQQAAKFKRQAGSARGCVHIHADFDAPLPEFDPYS
ncbi:MAG TPA: hypothetical protein VFC78_07825 [Tepidisphaeraceae bacterium]|nr:hypothetical protein [Tepidisphaeraceae bacterium]